MKRINQFVTANAENVVFTLALAALALGCWMAWPPLGLICPGAVVVGLFVVGRIRG